MSRVPCNTGGMINQNLKVDEKTEWVSVRRFRDQMGVVPSTVWRWIQRGWLDQPIDIGGRKYLTGEMVRRFNERAAHGEFAGGCMPPGRKTG